MSQEMQTQKTLATRDQAIVALLAYAFSGVLGPVTKGKSSVCYAPFKSTPETYSWIVSLDEALDFENPVRKPAYRYLIEVDRRSREVSSPVAIALPEKELAEAILAATGQHLNSSAKFADGSLSVSYIVTVEEHPEPDFAYVVQMRHFGNVASMDALLGHIAGTVDAAVLPVAAVFPIPGEKERQKATGWGRQITSFVPGIMAESAYPNLPHEDKIVFVRNMARAFQALWGLPILDNRLIGELIVDDDGPEVVLTTGPYRYHNLTGPYNSVRDWLRAHAKSFLVLLEKQQGIQEFQDKYLERLRDFVDNQMADRMPSIVEDVPIVPVHHSMDPHNVIVAAETPSEIRAVIDWEVVSTEPFAAAYGMIEYLFRRAAPNHFGKEYERADELREAFWGAIPEWRTVYEGEAVQTFLKWYRFATHLNAASPSKSKGDDRWEFWRENVRLIEAVLDN